MPILWTDARRQQRAKRRGAGGPLLRVVLTCLTAWMLVPRCAAQERVKEPATMESAPDVRGAAESIQYIGPDTYILLDSQGRPQAMPGMTYEDFMAAWQQLQQAGTHERQARFTLDHVEISGTAGGDRAELKFDITVRLLTNEPIDVPLGLTGAILRTQPEIGPAAEPNDRQAANDDAGGRSKADSEYLDFAPGQGGFVVHLVGSAGERRTVSLDMLVPLLRDGTETTLALNCPRALSSTLTLDVAAAVSDAIVSNGALLTREPLADDVTRLSASGLAGQFRISWSTAEVATTEFSSALSAAGAIQFSIDGRTVRSDARLTVRSYGGSFDRFRIRLPAGATLIPNRASAADKEPAYRIALENTTDSVDAQSSAAGRDQVALIQLPAKQQGPVVIELSTEQPLELKESDVAVSLAGFEVLGAVRQFGDVTLRVADDWQARWDTGQYVRQVDTSEVDAALQQPGLAGAFQYDRQPWSLGVRVSTRQIRVQVTPDHDIECLTDEARLRAHFTYQILGARAFEFRIDLQGWERTSDAIESGGLVDRDGSFLTDDGILVLPLSQPSLRRAEITVYLRRPVPRDARRIKLPLPIPVAESVATGDLVVEAAAGIELMPDAAHSIGLTATPVSSDTNGPASDSGSEFRFRCFQPDAVFVADRLNRSRDVAVDVASHIDIRSGRVQVSERIAYDVRFEPITELKLELPRELHLDEETAEVALLTGTGADDNTGVKNTDQPETRLRLSSKLDGGEATSADRSHRVRVLLPQPRLGRFTVELRYTLSRPEDAAVRETWSIPLARPEDGRAGNWRAIVRAPRDMSVAIDRTSGAVTWTQFESGPNSSGGNVNKEYSATRQETLLPLVVQAADVNLPSATIVERAWLQTWLTGTTRQDRAAFRFRTVGRKVTVELPPDAAVADVEVLLEGQPADSVVLESGRVTVQLPPPVDEDGVETDRLSAARPCTLELRSRRPSIDRVLTRRRLTPPQMVGAKSLADVYWQIVLPGDRHVIESPPQLAAASKWQWLGTFWGRRPTRSQAELEHWVGASAQQAPTSAQNEYLYCGLAPVSSIEVVTAPRWFIVLASSGAVLALALMWIYVPVVRRRWVVAASVCGLAGLAAAYPTPAMLLAQASVLGVVIAWVAALIARLTIRPTQWYLPIPGGSSHRQLTPQLMPRAESVVVGSMASAVASTAPPAPLPVPESKS